jgi:uncharacterized RDD family membrane protein YckC
MERCENCGRLLSDAERAFGVRRCTFCAESAFKAAPASEPPPPPSQLASFSERLVAYIIDYVIAGALSVGGLFGIGFMAAVIAVGAGADDDASYAATVVAGVTAAIVISAGYYWIGNGYGGTPGKRITKLGVVSAPDGGYLGFRRGLVRAVVQNFGGIPLYLGWLWCIWDPKKQTWHDKAARSMVVRNPAFPHVTDGARSGLTSPRFLIAAIVVVIVLLVGVVVGVIIGARSTDSELARVEGAIDRQAIQQANIDSIFPYCSTQWTEETADNTVGVLDDVLRLDDPSGAVEEMANHFQQLCDDGDSERFCRAYTESIATRTGGGVAMWNDLQAGCLLSFESFLNLQVGDCVVYADYAVDSAVDYEAEHDGVVIEVVTVTDAEYPGEDVILDYAYERCPLAADSYLYPLELDWRNGDRQIICLEDLLEP